MIAIETKKQELLAVILDKKLERFKGRVLFPEKLKKANNILAKAGVPKIK